MGILPKESIAHGAVGYWGPITATLDWCEQNYSDSIYIAEYWNTWSNLAMIIPPLYSMIIAIRMDIERRFALCYAFIMIVGFGSWLFHMTLRYDMQLMDELPMEWGILISVYCLITVHRPELDRNRWVQLAIVAYGVVLMAAYLYLKTPIIHQAGYGLANACNLYLDIMIIRKLNVDRKLFYTACALFYTGFAVWNIDNLMCDQLEQLRQQLPMILRPFTQFHALWHILAGYGCYVHCAFCVQVRSVAIGKPIEYKWSGLTLRPTRVQIEKRIN